MPRSPKSPKTKKTKEPETAGVLELDDETAAALLKNPRLVRELRAEVGKLKARLELYERREGREELPAAALELAFELAAVRRRARRWKEAARLLLDRSRSIAAMNDRLRRGMFDDRTLNEIEQDKRRRQEEEEAERQRQLAAVSGSLHTPHLVGGLGHRRRRF